MSIVKAESLTDVAFKLTQKALRADSKDQWSCWHGLFRHSVVAFGFEVASACDDGRPQYLLAIGRIMITAGGSNWCGK